MKLRNSAPFHSNQFLAVALSATFFCNFAASLASAQALYWDNDGATPGFGTAGGTWAAPTTGNGTQGWSSDATGSTNPGNVTTTTADTLNFGNTTTGLAAGSVMVSGTVDANRLTFASGSGVINLTGGTIVLGGTSPSITTNKAGQVIGSALTLNANTSVVTSVSSTAMTLNGKIDGPSNLTFTTANVSLAGANTFMILGAANTYAGTTTITTANINNNLVVRGTLNNALPTTTVLALNGGNGPSTGSRAVRYDLNNFDQTIAGLTNTPATNRSQQVLAGTGSSLLTINNTSPASYTFSGNITTGMSLAKSGTGTQILSGANSYPGNTNIIGGKLQGVVGGNCAASKMIISNALGTLSIGVTDNTKTWTCRELAPTAAGTIEFDFGSVTPSSTVSPLTITVPSTLTGLADFNVATPKIQVNVATGLLPGTYPLVTWDSVAGTVPTTAELTVSTITSGTSASLSVSGNTLNLVIASTAPVVVKANNTNNLNLGTSWSGGTPPDDTKIAKWNNLVTSPNTTLLGSNATWSGIAIENPNGPVVINGTNTLTLGAAAIDIDLSTANTADLTLNCPLTLGNANSWDVANNRTVTLGGQVSGAFSIEKLGAGTAVLASSANNYAGDTAVSAGTLKLGANNVVPDGIGNGNVSVAGTLDLNGKNETVNGLSGAGIVDNTLAAAAPTLTVGANDQSSSFAGVLQNSAGTLNLAKIGTGTLVLSGANTLSGSVTVNSGTLAFSNTAPFNNASGIIMAGGTRLRPDVGGNNLTVVAPPVTVGATGTTTTLTAPNAPANGTTAVSVTFGSPISGSGDVTFLGINSTNSFGTVILNGQSLYTGTTRLDCSNELATPSTLGNNNIFVRLGTENALPATTILTLAGGNGTGSGRSCELNLGGNNQTLAGLNNDISAFTARNQRVTSSNAATLTINNSVDCAFGGLGISSTFNGNPVNPTAQITGAITLAKSGSGTFTLRGPNTYTGATTIVGGTLTLGGANALPNTSAVSIGTATLSAANAGTETAGTLGITAAAAINLAAGSQIVFADSSAGGTATWAGTLDITGFVSGSSLNFGSSTGLTSQQLSKISATGFTNFTLDAEGDLTATPVSGNTFANWLVTNAPATGFVTDTDKDGLANGVENVLGSNPNSYNDGLTAISSTANSVTFKHTLNSNIASDITYGYQWSTNLSEWKTTGQTNTGGTTATIIPSTPVLGVVTVTITITGGPPAKLFGRLVAGN